MEIKNMIRFKKGASVATIVFTLIIAIFIFTAFYSFVRENEIQAGISPDANYMDAVNSMNKSSEDINNVKTNFQQLGTAAREADATDFGYYGIKGILAIMFVPFSLVNTATDLITSVQKSDNLIPPQIFNVAILIVTFIIIFAAITFLTNRGKDQT